MYSTYTLTPSANIQAPPPSLRASSADPRAHTQDCTVSPGISIPGHSQPHSLTTSSCVWSLLPRWAMAPWSSTTTDRWQYNGTLSLSIQHVPGKRNNTFGGSLACQTNFSRAHVAKSTSGDGCQHFVASAGMLAESN